MMLPMFGLFLALLFLGGFTSVPLLVDKYAADRAPYTFAAFFSGLTALILVPALFILVEAVEKKGLAINHTVGSVLVFAVPLISLCGGAFLGYRLGVNYRQRHAHLKQ
jgi:hypothetical protein